MTPAEPSSDRALLDHSRALIRSLQTREGAYPASPSFSAYKGFCWFRDGAFIADGMSAAGEVDSVDAFFAWCASVVRRYGDNIRAAVDGAAAGAPLADADMLPARFTFDGGRDGGDDWWDFQLDGFGTWLWALDAHAKRHGSDIRPHADAVALTVDYLISSWDRPCFDWWEEHDEQIHISTLGCVGAGLEAAARMGVLDAARTEAAASAADAIRHVILSQGVVDGHLVKWIGTTAVDASLTALISPLGFIPADHPVARSTVDAVESELAVDDGVHRFAADTFYGGGQWPLLSCFVGLARFALGDADKAAAYFDWAVSTATPSLDLPEQVDRHLLAPERRQEWIDKWGEVATPLLWSHAMVLRLAKELDR
ncbi:glycoside hydrolase family 15 protein [Demequina sp. TTPB684]|uniref:glycoside hydrolase family 15 protein n=1 Tax=unclassified Demequina TaxID=2620311 RepID=UPI001CF46448|nr:MULTISPECIES: glycoside hydrolase family 15 protein [unclassified Demequina]MCB2413155.1 glycoside hydrolase family 15 protein [Demequina sp. TTPB684]UPU89661.1 glycoside hydrolase family 15 protein [Demequina sp. TMPB413]